MILAQSENISKRIIEQKIQNLTESIFFDKKNEFFVKSIKFKAIYSNQFQIYEHIESI